MSKKNTAASQKWDFGGAEGERKYTFSNAHKHSLTASDSALMEGREEGRF